MIYNKDFVDIQSENLDFQDSGLLNVVANVTRTGVFVYSRFNVNTGELETIRQLRHPEDVEESMQTLQGIPVTNNHPEEMLTVETVKPLVVGMTSDRPKMIELPIEYDSKDSVKEKYVQQAFTIFDSDTIDDIRKGKHEVSLGYTLELKDESGVWNGEKYDCIQKNIRYNHLSLVNQARGGVDCRIQMDGKEINLDGVTLDEVLSNNQSIGDDMKVINIDGTEYDEAKVKALISTVSTKSEELAKLQATMDEMSAKLDAVEEDAKKKATQKQEATDAADFTAAVKARVALEKKASKVLGDDVALDGLSDRELKVKVISETTETSMDEKSDAYVDARYDMAVESAVEKKINMDSELNTVGATSMTNTDAESDSVKARKNYIERLLKGAK